MSVRNYYRELTKEDRFVSKKHLDFDFNNLSMNDFLNKVLFLYEMLDDFETANINLNFSCNYWESDVSCEEDF